MNCVSDHTVTFRSENGLVSAAVGMDIVETWVEEDVCPI